MLTALFAAASLLQFTTMQMGTCRATSSSSVSRTGYVSWCVDTESLTHVSTAPTPTTEQSSHPNCLSGPGSVPLLLLSPPEACGGETTRLPRPHTQIQRKTSVRVRRSWLNTHNKANQATDSHSNTGEGDDADRSLKPRESDSRSQEEVQKLPLLPRCSQVVSQHCRPISWHGEEPIASDASSSDSPCSAAESLSQNQCGQEMRSKPDPSQHHSSPVQEEKKQRASSTSSNLNHFLTSLFHLPFSGQQGLADERKGRRPSSCDASHTSDFSTTHIKQRSHSSIPEFSAGIFKTSCELEKENAHFAMVDMVLEVLEGVKWTLSSEQQMDTTNTTDTHQHTRTCTYTSWAEDSPICEHKHNTLHTQSCKRGTDEMSHTNTHSPHYIHTSQHTSDEEEGDTGGEDAEHQPKTFSVLSSDSGFEDCGVDASLMLKDSLTNAERLAQQLVLEFKRTWLPSHEPQRGRLSLRSSLQELPGTGSVAASSDSLTQEIRLRTRMRGSLSWAPPRFQIIFTVQPTLRRSEVVALQHFLCAGCGTKVEPRYIKKLRYCDYLGRYFCDCCHNGSEAVIPGRVLSCWDFSRYHVSDFSKQLLDSVWFQPLFDLNCVGKTLSSRVKELDRFKGLQEQLLGIIKLLKACRLSASVLTEARQLPTHLFYQQPPLFSMDDLLRVKKGQLVAQARAVLHAAISHVESCELCLARGFICEFCRDRDIIFPFQSDICLRCPVCKACFHRHCFMEKKCPKCARIQSRRKRVEGSRTCDG